MAEDFSDKVKTLLEDPEMLLKIASIAGGLGLGKSSQNSPESGAENPPPSEPPANTEPAQAAIKIPEIPKILPKQDSRLALLAALKPFLRPEKQAKIENLTRALSVANLMGTLKDKK